jgi:hypothetical protein
MLLVHNIAFQFKFQFQLKLLFILLIIQFKLVLDNQLLFRLQVHAYCICVFFQLTLFSVYINLGVVITLGVFILSDILALFFQKFGEDNSFTLFITGANIQFKASSKSLLGSQS